MTEPKHSPLPWTAFDEIEDGLVIYDANGLIVHLTDHYKMIVAAVNSHTDLLTAAKAALVDGGFENTAAYDDLKSAIARAEQA